MVVVQVPFYAVNAALGPELSAVQQQKLYTLCFVFVVSVDLLRAHSLDSVHYNIVGSLGVLVVYAFSVQHCVFSWHTRCVFYSVYNTVYFLSVQCCAFSQHARCLIFQQKSLSHHYRGIFTQSSVQNPISSSTSDDCRASASTGSQWASGPLLGNSKTIIWCLLSHSEMDFFYCFKLLPCTWADDRRLMTRLAQQRILTPSHYHHHVSQLIWCFHCAVRFLPGVTEPMHSKKFHFLLIIQRFASHQGVFWKTWDVLPVRSFCIDTDSILNYFCPVSF